jgi:cytochrome c-type biogenesis protein CcmH/NrfF
MNNIEKYLSVDAAFLMDDFSREVYRLFNEGKTEEELINYINENK